MLNIHMSLKNNFLIGLPSILDTSFSKSVVYLNSHTGDSSTGWIVNKPLDEKIAAKLRIGMRLNIALPVHYGGPVDINSAYVLHSNDFHIPSTIQINDTLSVTRDKAIINIFNIGQFPKHWKIIVGSSAWGAGQLESELLGSRTKGVGSWVTLPYSTSLMWDTASEQQWDTGIRAGAEHLTDTVLNF